jgi:murein DD-endopeptidase MepM/ murein hydrolase activator NlpD
MHRTFKTMLLFIGMLLLPGLLASSAQAQNCDTYTVDEGDNLYDIAQTCRIPVPAIIEANISINEPDILTPGDTLEIPSAEEARDPQVTIYPLSVRPGERITVIANGFPLTTPVNVQAGIDASEVLIEQTVETDRQGAVQTQLTIPPTAELDDRWRVVVETTGNPPAYEARSFAFFINEETTRPVQPQPTQPAENLFRQTDIYLIQEGTGSVGCGDSVVPYTVSIEPTVAPLTAAYEQLFSLGTEAYGYRNALGNSDLALGGIDIVNGVATVNLTGDFSIAGTCSAPRVEAQLRQTALQYVTIDSVNIFINGQPLADVLSQR